MTTDLYKAVVAAKLSEQQALDVFQEAGAISDLCLKLSDVAESDCLKAILALSIHMRHVKMKTKGNRWFTN